MTVKTFSPTVCGRPHVLVGATAVQYIVGNCKFYDVMVPTEHIYAGLLRQHGFTDVTVENIRKRNSKKELFEFVVSGRICGKCQLVELASRKARLRT